MLTIEIARLHTWSRGFVRFYQQLQPHNSVIEHASIELVPQSRNLLCHVAESLVAIENHTPAVTAISLQSIDILFR